MLIHIDGGTTNTRLYLTDGEKVFSSVKKKVGAGSNQNGSLAAAVREGLGELLARNALSLADIDGITASGMIGSELGLHAMDYVSAPASVADIAAKAESVLLPEVCEKPIVFFPGVCVREGELADMDIMRGEETEYFGLIRALNVKGRVVVVLPGTHCKIMVGTEDKIERFRTTMSGEVLGAVAKNTILSRSVELSAGYDEAMFLCGAEMENKLGLLGALFKIRVSDKFLALTPAQKKSLLTGMMRAGDVRAIEEAVKRDGVKTVILAGDEPMKSEPLPLLRSLGGEARVLIADDTATDAATALAGVAIWAKKRA